MHDGENHFQPAIGVKEPFSIVLVVKATQLKNHQEQMCTQDREVFFFFFYICRHLCLSLLALASSLVFSPPFESPDFVSCLAAILNLNCFVSSRNENPARLKAATPSPFCEGKIRGTQNDTPMKRKLGGGDKQYRSSFPRTMKFVFLFSRRCFFKIVFCSSSRTNSSVPFNSENKKPPRTSSYSSSSVHCESRCVRKGREYTTSSPPVSPPPYSPSHALFPLTFYFSLSFFN